jgi:porphobilinogen synthase
MMPTQRQFEEQFESKLESHEQHARTAQRPRRLRRTAAIRALVRENVLLPEQLVLPVFVMDGDDRADPIHSMPGCARLTIDRVLETCEQALELGVCAVALFPRIADERKTPDGAEALRDNNLVCRAVRSIKRHVPDICVITDVALDAYSSLGHDGLVGAGGVILNDQTVEVLARMAVLHAAAGADMVAPSDMMDGRVGAIRSALDDRHFTDTIILSYCIKYASSFYGPFREALDSAPVQHSGVPRDKATYQMDCANAREAYREAALDEREGADILMIKPGMPCLDIIAPVRQATNLPIAAYQVSGEYAMIKAAAAAGWLDEKRCVLESLLAIRRAGADIIFSYFALDYARWFRESRA